MHVIRVRNVHQALPEALYRLRFAGRDRESRNGMVRKFDAPVTTIYEKPLERVIYWAARDANPFLHFFESLWMLAGRNDVAYVGKFAKNMFNYSDDGKTMHGAYGHRWRQHFAFDQLDAIVTALTKDRNDRRCVLGMWDPRTDLGREGKDFPCNTIATLQVNDDGELDLSVFNRSNDIVWGAYGANGVHFSFLLEYVAAATGLPVGRYYQISTNFHAYHATLTKVEQLADCAAQVVGGELSRHQSPYETGAVEPFPLVNGPMSQWHDDLMMFMDHPEAMGLKDRFFRKVAVPMWQIHEIYKNRELGAKRYQMAIDHAFSHLYASDWQMAVVEWLERRLSEYLRAQDDGAQGARSE